MTLYHNQNIHNPTDRILNDCSEAEILHFNSNPSPPVQALRAAGKLAFGQVAMARFQ